MKRRRWCAYRDGFEGASDAFGAFDAQATLPAMASQSAPLSTDSIVKGRFSGIWKSVTSVYVFVRRGPMTFTNQPATPLQRGSIRTLRRTKRRLGASTTRSAFPFRVADLPKETAFGLFLLHRHAQIDHEASSAAGAEVPRLDHEVDLAHESRNVLAPLGPQNLEGSRLDGRPRHFELILPRGDALVAAARVLKVERRRERPVKDEWYAPLADLGDRIVHDEQIVDPIIEPELHVAGRPAVDDRRPVRAHLEVARRDKGPAPIEDARLPEQLRVDDPGVTSVRPDVQIADREARGRLDADLRTPGQAELARRQVESEDAGGDRRLELPVISGSDLERTVLQFAVRKGTAAPDKGADPFSTSPSSQPETVSCARWSLRAGR